jgi:hypothetical protein
MMGDIADSIVGSLWGDEPEDEDGPENEYYFHSNRYAPVYKKRERATNADFDDLQSTAPCQRVRSDGKVCGLVAPCPDCGKTLLYWPAE